MILLKKQGGINMKTSEKGKELIKSFEGVRLKAYKCVPSEIYYTIGFGHYGKDVTPGMTITMETADKLFNKDLLKYEKCVNAYMDIYNFNQNQYDALVSFTFNCGGGNLNKLTANGTRTISQISEKIPEYNKSNGKIIKGLATRRIKERQLFDTPVKVKNETVLKPSKICLNISKREVLCNVTPTFLLDFTFDCFILCEKFEFYGTGNLDICDGVVCELCCLESKETGRVELCYIPCDNLRS